MKTHDSEQDRAKRLWLESVGVKPFFVLKKPPLTVHSPAPVTPSENVKKRKKEAEISTPDNARRAQNPPDRTSVEPSWKQEAEEAARQAKTLPQLRKALEDYPHCALKNTARKLVFSRGKADSGLLVLGEAPGREEDAQGLPFVGRSGRLLDAMFQSAGIVDPYITNVVPWRPPGNRDPSPLEREQCRPFLHRHIALVAPSVLLLLGRFATQEMLQTDETIGSLQGKWHRVKMEHFSAHAFVLYHPSYGLRNPQGKRTIWAGILTLAQSLEEKKRSSPQGK